MKMLLVLLGTFGLLVAASSVSAAILFQDNFENATEIATDAFPDSASGDCDPVAQIGTWEITGTAGSDEDLEYLAQVTNYDTPGAYQGNNYLRIGWSAQAYANGYLADGATTDDLTVSVWFYANADQTNDGRLFLYDDQNTYLIFVRMGENNVAGGLTGQVAWSDNGTWTNSSIDDGYAADTWHHLEVATDWANGQFSVTLDDELLGTAAFSNPSASNIDHININGWTSGDPPAMFDDVLVYHSDTVFMPGDADLNGIVDESDAATLASNWLASGVGWTGGDFNDDGVVDDIDATLLAANWQVATSTAVPEPGTFALLASISIILLWQRKR